MAGSDLRTTIGTLEIAPCVFNASGPLSTRDEELWALAESDAGAVVLKSATLEPRAGNPEPRLWRDSLRGTSLNSNGLCNLGCEGHARQVERLRAEFGKPVIASIAGLSAQDYPAMAERLGRVASAIEVNLSCPNIPGKPQMAFDLEAARSVLKAVRRSTRCDLWVKLPPYQDRAMVEAMAQLLLDVGVQAAVCINSPSGLEIDFETEQTRIHPNGGMGGAGGRDILRIARWNIRQFFLALAGKVDVVGVGGVYSGLDLYGHLLCGAGAVEVGTSYLEEGPKIFGRLKRELHEVLAERGVPGIAAKIGALRVAPVEA